MLIQLEIAVDIVAQLIMISLKEADVGEGERLRRVSNRWLFFFLVTLLLCAIAHVCVLEL